MIIELPKDINGVVEVMEAAKNAIFAHCGYKQDWVVFPLDDQRDAYWCVEPSERGEVRWAEAPETLVDEEAGKYYNGAVYTQRFLKKWVFRGAELTLAVVDTQCDGNKLLMIFNNAKEQPWPTT